MASINPEIQKSARYIRNNTLDTDWISFSPYQLSKEEIELLAKALEQNTTLKKLSFGEQHFGEGPNPGQICKLKVTYLVNVLKR